MRAFCVRQVCTQCGNLLKNDMWGFVYKRELLLERKVQVLNTVIISGLCLAECPNTFQSG
jgi:hypothetical protein